MKNVNIDSFYICKVTKQIVTVKIVAENPEGGWDAVNTATGKKVHIKDARRLIKEVAPPEAQGKKPSKPEQRPQNKISLLDAAAKVLEKQSPLTCKELIEQMAKAELWTSQATTPANTLHAALSKEIRVKGDNSRFEKADRGQFQLKAS